MAGARRGGEQPHQHRAGGATWRRARHAHAQDVAARAPRPVAGAGALGIPVGGGGRHHPEEGRGPAAH
eukprot:1266910-Pyramimonas_sp.AAC.1